MWPLSLSISEIFTKWLMGGSVHKVDILDKGMIYIQVGWREKADMRFHKAAQNEKQLKTYELFVEFFIYYF